MRDFEDLAKRSAVFFKNYKPFIGCPSFGPDVGASCDWKRPLKLYARLRFKRI